MAKFLMIVYFFLRQKWRIRFDIILILTRTIYKLKNFDLYKSVAKHKHKYDKISENLQKYADSEGKLNFELRKFVEKKNEIKNKYDEDLKNAQDSVKDFSNFIGLIEIIEAKPENFKKKIIGQIKAHFLKDNEKVEEKYIEVIMDMIKKYKNYVTEKNEKVKNLLAM
ncbi:unnamed protein product [Meloidogyne enterolobii]|uniref:Uncharacterized protein n=1 Tax=Meloidogyne enterolobii TaxID=390850 RepID=A0ACB1AX53_MELEN